MPVYFCRIHHCIRFRVALPSLSFPQVFSSLLCSRTMLRRPSVSPSIVREEGCSSTAIGAPVPNSPRAWNNLADRGSRGEFGTGAPAVP